MFGISPLHGHMRRARRNGKAGLDHGLPASAVPAIVLAGDTAPSRALSDVQHELRRYDPKSLYCCGEADVVKTKFKVESTGGPHPEDVWYAWLNEAWVQIPPGRS